MPTRERWGRTGASGPWPARPAAGRAQEPPGCPMHGAHRRKAALHSAWRGGDKNGKIPHNVIDSRLFPLKNKRQILVRVSAAFQKDTMDMERKKNVSYPRKLLTPAAARGGATDAAPDKRLSRGGAQTPAGEARARSQQASKVSIPPERLSFIFL